MRLLAAGLLLAAGGCGQAAVEKSFDGVEAVLRSPTKVEAFRVGTADGNPHSTDYRAMPETAGPVAVDPATASELARILLDPKSYSPHPKPCVPNPGVKLRFTAGSRTVEVFLCFECSELFVYEGARSRGALEFDPAHGSLVIVVKRLFPKDPAIQALK